MAKSTYNYIHVTKHAITVGVKGEEQKRYTYKSIASKIRKVEKYSKKYSQMYYGKNLDFPRELGVGKTNVFTQHLKTSLGKIERGETGVFTKADLNAMDKIFSMADDIKVLRDEYYKKVALHYGVEGNRFEIKKLLKEKKLNISYDTKTNKVYGGENPLTYTVSDPTSLINWILKNIDGAKEIENILVDVKNVNYLRKVVQEYDLYKDTSFIEELKEVFNDDIVTENNTDI